MQSVQILSSNLDLEVGIKNKIKAISSSTEFNSIF